jgi:transcriptional regulator with XRE-family HTH domain
MRSFLTCYCSRAALGLLFQEDGNRVLQPSDTPTSQSIAARWTFYRRFGLLLRTRLDDEGATLSLREIADRTHGRLSADTLTQLLSQGVLAQPDPVTYVLLAQAFDVDPDFFVSDEAVSDYIAGIRLRFAALERPAGESNVTLQLQAYAVARDEQPLAAAV